MIYAGIVVLLAIVSWILYAAKDFLPGLKFIETKLLKKSASRFAVSVNYNISAVLKDRLKKLVALNVTITNKRNFDLNNLSIAAGPGYKLVNYADIMIQDEETKRFNSFSSQEFKPLNTADFSVDAGQEKTGYVLFEALNDNDEIDKLIVTCNDETAEIQVNNKQIADERKVKMLAA